VDEGTTRPTQKAHHPSRSHDRLHVAHNRGHPDKPLTQEVTANFVKSHK